MVKVIVVEVDGGVCSQLTFFAKALAEAKKDNKVFLDLKWYKSGHTDLTGTAARPYLLPKMIDSGKLFGSASRFLVRTAKFCARKGWFKSLIDYRKGYEDYYIGVAESLSDLRSCFKINLADLTPGQTAALSEIKSNLSCGVHCRRGDLAGDNPVYGRELPASYFANVIGRLYSANPEMVFFFFSDEMDWVEANVVPLLPGGISKRFISSGDDGCHVDLFLLSNCKTIISSNGSMGRFAWLLSDSDSVLYSSRVDGPSFPRQVRDAVLADVPGKVLMVCDDDGNVNCRHSGDGQGL